MASANFLDYRVVEDMYADRIKVVPFERVKDDTKSKEELTASGVAVSGLVLLT